MTHYHLHLVSDATGETINSVARACLVQFRDVEPHEHTWPLIRTPTQMTRVLTGIEHHPGPVLFTLVNEDLRARLIEGCRRMGVPCIPVLDPVIHALAAYFGLPISGQPGLQHVLDTQYFERIDAMNFALSHDDGHSAAQIEQADVVLVGVSRTSKTPTAIYLANRGVKAANVPYVPGLSLPQSLFNLDGPMVVGLTKDPERLVQVRRQRLELGPDDPPDSDYVEYDSVRREVAEARKLFTRKGWLVIDVTRRSIEETAATILSHLASHRTGEA